MRIKKQLSLLAVIFVFSIVFNYFYKIQRMANGFINFENGKKFGNSSVQLFALVTLFIIIFFYRSIIYILLIL